jgi:hypothetical protein
MKPSSIFLHLSCSVLAAVPFLLDCQGQAADSKAEPSALTTKLVIDGEHFRFHTIPDSQQGGLAVGAFATPEKWKVNSQVVWNYQHTESPVTYSYSAENPSNEEGIFTYPPLQFFGLRPDSNLYQPGQNYLGSIFQHQAQPPAQILLTFIRQLRASQTNLQVIGFKDLPDLPTAFKMPLVDNRRGLGMKVTYDLKGKPVEEEFYAISYSGNIPYDGPQGRTWEAKWGLGCLHSFRAPLGTLEKRRPVFAAIAKSFRQNPAWETRRAAIVTFLGEQFNRQLQAGYDSIAAAGRLSQQISANNDAMIASIDRQLAASRTTSGGSSVPSARSSNDKYDDYIRGVETTEDPYWGTSQHSISEQYHWTDGYGSYRNSNDPSYDPNRKENGSWQLMQPAR